MKRSKHRKPSRRNTYGGSRHRRGRSNVNIGKIVGLVALPLAVLGGGGVAMSYYMGIEKPDSDFCYLRDDQHKSAVFVDNSLRDLSAAQMRDYRTALHDAYDRAPPNARIMVFSTASDVQQSQARPVLAMCKPPATSAEQEAIGAPSETKPFLARRAAEARRIFEVRIDEILADVEDRSKRAGDSPILEQLRAISRYDGFAGASRDLWAITDGLQNSETARFCAVKGDMPPYAKFAKRPAFANVEPRSFAGTNVSVLLVESAQLPQPGLQHCTHAEMRAWWPAYFKGNGAQAVELTPLRRWAGS